MSDTMRRLLIVFIFEFLSDTLIDNKSCAAIMVNNFKKSMLDV